MPACLLRLVRAPLHIMAQPLAIDSGGSGRHIGCRGCVHDTVMPGAHAWTRYGHWWHRIMLPGVSASGFQCTAVTAFMQVQEVQRGKQLAERAQSTSKLLREDIKGGQRGAPRADGSPSTETEQDPSGVAGLTKRLEDYVAAFEQISAATGTPSNSCQCLL